MDIEQKLNKLKLCGIWIEIGNKEKAIGDILYIDKEVKNIVIPEGIKLLRIGKNSREWQVDSIKMPRV